ncbi:MAG: hypothetical protein LC799_24330 [Actinobacteria bacterium]|nr:hypothetical protein [Actinomycetota bacterium]
MSRRRPTRQGEPANLVLDNEALGQLSGGRPSRSLLVALEAAAATTGRILLSTSVVVERGYDPSAPVAADANRLLRTAHDDELTRSRAVEAGRLRERAHHGASVVDAHVAATALAVIRNHGGTATILTSDGGDMKRLLDASDDTGTRTSASIQAL